jgi:hypothetical protein
MADYYKILQVEPGAGKKEILVSYRRLCKMYHPDLNPAAEAEDLMKSINLAYSILHDDRRRSEYDRRFGAFEGKKTKQRERNYFDLESRKASNAVNQYFQYLVDGLYERAFDMLSAYDKEHITLKNFCKWRDSVQRLYTVCGFTIKKAEAVDDLLFPGFNPMAARKLYVDILEKNNATAQTNAYLFAKFAVKDKDGWRVFLGHKDLNEIALMFENIFREQEKETVYRHWEEYCNHMNRSLDMLNYAGFIKESGKDVYRAQRYNQTFTVAAIFIAADETAPRENLLRLWEKTAVVLKKSLRETDIPAYIGEGVFVVLFVGLKKRRASFIIERLLDIIKREIQPDNRVALRTEYKFDVYGGGDFKAWTADFISGFPPEKHREAL